MVGDLQYTRGNYICIYAVHGDRTFKPLLYTALIIEPQKFLYSDTDFGFWLLYSVYI